VEGGFNNVWHHLLLRRLENLGFADQFTKWVASYLSKREYPRGLPQGSPLSPVLFTLYLSGVVEGRDKFGYMDDVLVKSTASTPRAARALLTAKVGRVIRLLEELYCLVAPAKSEYLLASRGTVCPEPLRVVGLPTLRPKPIVRWLGYWIDSRLKFDTYVK